MTTGFLPAAPGDAAATRAGIAVERLLNTWLRERMAGVVPVEGEPCLIDLSARRLFAFCLRSSPGGFHRWRLPVRVQAADGTSMAVDDPVVVADLMADVLSSGAGSAAQAIRDRLLSAVRTAEEHGRACAAQVPDLSPMGMEQALWHGHPFHPFAKSIDGFSAEDIERYTPERRNAFQLRWLLVEPEIGGALWRDARAESVSRGLLAELSGLPQQAIGDRVLIPSHPWQAARLESDPAFADLVAQRRAVLTLPTGVAVRPTSSVRTVFADAAGIFLKLPIQAKITNFARINPREHITRSLATSRAIDALADDVAAAGFDILAEPGALWVEQAGLEAVTGVVLREGPPDKAFILAGLLEPSPSNGRSMLGGLNCSLSRPAGAEPWLHDYVRVAILPPLRLFTRTGISVEAHSQNSLLVLDQGNPARLILRDLEGVSIDRARFERAAPKLDLDASVFFSAEEARHRLTYYLIGNNLNHVIATIAGLTDTSEAKLWSLAAETLAAAVEDGPTAELIEGLLVAESLPLKANFSSCFAGHGERPDYVTFANPMRTVTPTARPREKMASL